MFDVRAGADALGYPATLVGMLVESAGLPFPGAGLLLAVSAYAAAGHLHVAVVLACGTAGAVVGGDVGYLAGYLGGRPFVERMAAWLRLPPSHLARSEMFFVRHGGKAVLLGRFATGARSWSAVLAGMSHMPFWPFQVYSAAGALAWTSAATGAGYLVGTNWDLVAGAIAQVGPAWLGILAAALVIYLLLARRRVSQTWPPRPR